MVGIGADAPPEPRKQEQPTVSSQEANGAVEMRGQAVALPPKTRWGVWVLIGWLIGSRFVVRYDWYQTVSHVIVTLMIKNAKKEDVKVEFGERTVS